MADYPLDQVGVVIADNALHDRRDALQSHAGVHRWLWQRSQNAIRRTIELHENIVPDFHVAVTIASNGTVLAATASGLALS